MIADLEFLNIPGLGPAALFCAVVGTAYYVLWRTQLGITMRHGFSVVRAVAPSFLLLRRAACDDRRAVLSIERKLQQHEEANRLIASFAMKVELTADEQLRLGECMLLQSTEEATLYAASDLPDRSYIPWLEKWSEHKPNKPNKLVNDLLVACQALPSQAGEQPQSPQVQPVEAPQVTEFFELNADLTADYKLLRRALPKASLTVLMTNLVKALDIENASTAELISKEIHRRSELDVMVIAGTWSRDPAPSKRAGAAIALARDGWEDQDVEVPRPITEMLGRLAVDPVDSVAIAALDAISKRVAHLSKSLLEKLRRLESHPRDEVRWAYVMMLLSPRSDFQVRSYSNNTVWFRLTKDPSSKIREMACLELWKCAREKSYRDEINRSDVRQALMDCLKDAHRPTRVRAMCALAELASPRAFGGKRGVLVPLVADELELFDREHLTMTSGELSEAFTWLKEMIVAVPSRRLIPAVKNCQSYANNHPDLKDWVEKSLLPEMIRHCNCED
jgi:hypothetical protein